MKYIMELCKNRSISMLLHAVIIGILLYVIMVFALGQKPAVAANRSLIIAALVLIYMLLFGHGWPTTIRMGVSP